MNIKKYRATCGIILLLFITLLGCSNNEQLQHRLDIERHLPGLYRNNENGKFVESYIDAYRYMMLDYGFYIEVVKNSTGCRMIFVEFNERGDEYTESAIALKLSNTPDSIQYNYKSNILKLQSYIKNSSYFNQEYNLNNKINALQYIVKQIIYILENNKNCMITYADCKRLREIKLSNTEIKSDTINWTFCSGNTQNYYSLSLITANECIIDLLTK